MRNLLSFLVLLSGACVLRADINLNISLGQAGPTQGEMSFLLKSGTLSVDTAKEASWEYLGMASGPVQVITGTTGRRQIVSPNGLADLADVKDGGGAYLYTDLNLYLASGTLSGGYYTGSGAPYKTTRFTYASVAATPPATLGIDQLTVSGSDSYGVETTVYEYDRDAATWSLITDNGERKETQSQTVASGTRVVTTEIRDGANILASKTRKFYVTYGWGEQLIQQVADPDGAALTSTWIYETGTSSNGYGQVIASKDGNGHWQRFEYDSEGRPTKVVTQYLDAADTATDSQSLMRTISYSGDNQTEVVTLLGTEIGRRYTLWSGTTGSRAKRVEDCVTAGASSGASDSAVTITVYSGSTETTTLPDGTVVKTTKSSLGGGALRTTVEAGEASGGSVIAGKRSLVDQDARGNVIKQEVYDIAGSLLIGRAEGTAFDAFGRATTVEYLDGTIEQLTYGCCGLEQKIDAMGLITSYAHDDFGNVSLITRAGISIASEYDPLGRLKRRYRIGSDSSSILIEGADYNLAGRPTAMYSQSGTTSVSISSGTSGVLTSTQTLPGGATRIARVYPDGRVKELGGTAAFPRKYEYGVDGGDGKFLKEILVGDSGSEAQWTKTFFDLLGRPWKTLYPDAAASTNYFNTQARLVRQVDPDGVTALYAYNSLGEREYTAIDANGNNTIDFGGSDRIARVQRGYLTAHGQTVRRVTTSVWSSTSATTLAESDTSLTSLEQWVSSQGVESHVVTSGSGGDWTTVAASNSGRGVTDTYTSGRLVSSVVTGSGGIIASAQEFAYDPHGRVSGQQVAGFSNISYTHTDADLVASVTQGSTSVAYEYDALGRRTKTIRNGSVETGSEYYPNGLLESVSGALAYPVSYTYDPQGRLKTLTTTGQAGNAVTTWNYDSERGWLTSKRYADSQGPDYTHTPAGRAATRAWARGVTTTYGYNDAGELTGIDYSDSTPDITYTRNRLGQIDGVADGIGTRAFTLAADGRPLGELHTSGTLNGMGTTIGYDALSRRNALHALLGSGTSTVAYGYDGASRLATVTSGSDVATYGYLADTSAVESLTQSQGAGAILTTTKAYDTLGRLASQSAATGTATVFSSTHGFNPLHQTTSAQLNDGSSWAYGYDGTGQLTSAERTWSGSVPVAGQQFAYAYDSIGNRIETTVNSRPATYTANALNQYTSRGIPGAIDVVGSATSSATVTVNSQSTTRQGDYFHKALTIDNSAEAQYPEVTVTAVLNNSGTGGEDLVAEQSGHRFVPKTPEAFTYDDDGNVLADGRWHYTWDAENRLVAMESGTSAPEGSKRKLTFAYDAGGRRISKNVYTYSGSAYVLSEQRRFVYDGWNLAAELSGSNTIISSYTWGKDLLGGRQTAGGVGGLLKIRQGGESYYPAYGTGGNVMALVQAADQSIAARYHYGAFGEPIQISEQGVENPFRFSTKYFDPETESSYYGYRYYSPSQGRWLGRDPIAEFGGLNVYGFVANSPKNYYDPFGLSGLEVIGAGGALATQAEVNAAMAALGVGTGIGTAAATGMALLPLGVLILNDTPIAATPDFTYSEYWTDFAFRKLDPTAYEKYQAALNAPPAEQNEWEKYQREYWKQRSQNTYEGEYSNADLLRMSQGLPPLDTDRVCIGGQWYSKKWLEEGIADGTLAQILDAAKGAGGVADDFVTLFHQGNLRGGQVSSTRSLSTSLSSDLSHYHPGAPLNQFNVPRSTFNQWMDDGLATPFNDLHAPTGIVTPELRIAPPASGQLNQFLIH